MQPEQRSPSLASVLPVGNAALRSVRNSPGWSSSTRAIVVCGAWVPVLRGRRPPRGSTAAGGHLAIGRVPGTWGGTPLLSVHGGRRRRGQAAHQRAAYVGPARRLRRGGRRHEVLRRGPPA